MNLRAVLQTVFSVPHTPLEVPKNSLLEELVEKDIASSEMLIMLSRASSHHMNAMAEVIDGLMEQ